MKDHKIRASSYIPKNKRQLTTKAEQDSKQMYYGLTNFYSVKQQVPNVISKSKADHYEDDISNASIITKIKIFAINSLTFYF